MGEKSIIMRNKAFAVILILVFLILAGLFICPKFINTEKIKNKVIEIFREKYGYEVKIDSVSISLFFGAKAYLNKIELKSLNKDRYSLDIKSNAVEASMKLIPLLKRKFEIGRITIDEPVIVLEENPPDQDKTTAEEKPIALPDSVALPLKKTPQIIPDRYGIEDISISRLSIKNGYIKFKSYKLLSKKISELELSDIDLDILPLALDRPIRIKTQAKLKIIEQDGIRMLFSRPLEISLDEEIRIEKEKVVIKELKLGIDSIAISLSGSFSNPGEPFIEAMLSTGEVNLSSFKEFMNFARGQAMSGILHFNGRLSGQLNKYSKDNLACFIELKEAEFSGFVPNSTCKLTGRFDLSSSSILKEMFAGNLNSAQITGRLLLPSGNFNKIKFQDMNSEINYQNNTINLSPVELSLYDGNFRGTISAANLLAEPDFNLKAEVRDLQVEKLLADTSTLKNTICGRLYSQLSVNGRGKNMPEINQAMKGNMHVELKDGKITTLNLFKAILSVAGMLTGMRPPEGDYTQVDILTSDVVISGGKAETNNLRLLSKGMEVTGQGYFNFDQNINFTMDACVGTVREGYEGGGGFIGKYLKDKFGRIVVPIKVTGTISKPHVSLDTSRLAKDIFNQEIKELLPRILK